MSAEPPERAHKARVDALRAFVAEAPFDLCMVDLDGRILEGSPSFFEAAGARPEDLRGRLVREAFDVDREVAQKVNKVRDFDSHLEMPPNRIVTPGGEERWIQTVVTPWRDADGDVGGHVFFSRNVTDERQVKLERERTEAMLHAVVESIPLMLSVQDVETREFLRVNRAAEAFLGMSRAQIVGKGVLTHLGDEAVERHGARISIAMASGELDLDEQEVTDGQGRQRVLEVRRQVIAGGDGSRLLLSVSEDITDRRRAADALQAAAEAAEAANRLKSDFLATVSHEIRTPLNGVLGMAQAMARDPLSDMQRERLEVIRQSGEVLLALLNDVLDLSKIEAGKLELEAIDFDLVETVRGAAAAYAPIAAGKGLSLGLDLDAAAGAFHGDPTRVRQIVGNLISNAVKFTDAGQVTVSAAHDGQRLSLTVADTGAGIAPEVMAKLFDKFVQADATTTRRFGGTGLGLAICRELAEMMGGEIVARSAPGEGAAFTLTLPLPRVGAVIARAAPEPRKSSERALRVLAAEDNVVNQLVLKAIFEQIGVAVTVVGDGAQAVEACRRETWDVILMDVQMPVMDGPSATRAIRAQELAEGKRRTPIIALTADAMAHQAAAHLACGMDRLVAKPLQIEELLNAIDELVADPPLDAPDALSA